MNAITDHYRSRRPASDIDEAIGLADTAAPPDETVMQSIEAARVWAVIDALPQAQRTAMTLKLGSDLKLAQIGEIMGRSEGAIKLLIHRGMTTVRAKLEVGSEAMSGEAETAG